MDEGFDVVGLDFDRSGVIEFDGGGESLSEADRGGDPLFGVGFGIDDAVRAEYVARGFQHLRVELAIVENEDALGVVGVDRRPGDGGKGFQSDRSDGG